MGRRIALTLVIFALAPALPATAGAAPTWLTPDPIAAGDPGSSGADVAMAPDGRAVVVWSGSDRKVMGAVRPPGGPWGEPKELATANYCCPQVALDAAGNAIAAFDTCQTGANCRVWARTLAAGAADWAAAQDLSGVLGFPESVSLAADPAGNAIVGWIDTDASGFYQVYVRHRAADGTLSPQVDKVSTGNGDCCPDVDVAMAGNGTSMVVWDRFASGQPLASKGSVQARTRAADGSWAPPLANAPQQLGGPYDGSVRYEPRVAADPLGNALAVWLPAGNAIAGSARSTAGGWEAVTIAGASALNFYPTVALDAAGLATVAWCGPATPSGREVKVARRPAGAPFEPTVAVSAPQSATCRPTVAAGPGGAALVLWATTDKIIRANIRPPGGAFGAARDISVVGGANFASGAFDAVGNAVAAWHRSAGVEAAGFDASSPEARGVVVPGEATTGSAVAMSVSPFDRWSAVTAAWDFGDGKSATGTAVSNTYALAGRYDVTLTLTDAVGNVATSAHVVVVTDPPAAPGTGTPTGTGTGTGTGEPTVLPRILSKVGAHWLAFRTYSRLTRLDLVDMPSGSTAEVRCIGPRGHSRSRRRGRARGRRFGCPFVSRRFKARTATKRRSILRFFRGRRLPLRTRLEIRYTAPGHIGRVVSYRVVRRKTPKAVIRCLPPGGAPVRC